uniref:Uncharacterized protein n=1 Tax=Tetraselmis chuii TaxID=63592 RepID=A0A7S1SJB7_9CHLO|mmetsp:Transcript_15401/g.27259  ORF Transcript_15401/g.27259 Transcript_15401/m.27259 type:complete len:315 (+) Transcript_15401:149-1093(+)|eukprot:CAMPEP_0177759624 /NCGR_PEP_ID=MMETSP0491_2-20121128/4831_1 /TAXON_ID=63592 /ORGANISM="Tetraselmis chuii, Strain PLY429" /LENGTH=314 /DNA_ID=CAMNT_0019275465 /DNA_START=141 /DNA_END=1085 /DNA_ORIENTATION=+
MAPAVVAAVLQPVHRAAAPSARPRPNGTKPSPSPPPTRLLPNHNPRRDTGRVFASSDNDEDRNRQYGDKTEVDAPQVRGDWRAFRAGLVAKEHAAFMTDAGTQDTIQLSYGASPQSTSRWAHLISQPEEGCLLVTRQPDMGFFDRTVILLLNHENSQGSYGLVLNRQSTLMVRDVGLEPGSLKAFGGNPLYLGGPVELRVLGVVHGVPGVTGAEEVTPGVFHGGVRDAAELVNGGQADASEFQLVAGYSGWGPHQLSGEIHDKSWYVISASRDIILECARIRGADEWVVRSNIWEDILRLAGIDPYGIGSDSHM